MHHALNQVPQSPWHNNIIVLVLLCFNRMYDFICHDSEEGSKLYNFTRSGLKQNRITHETVKFPQSPQMLQVHFKTHTGPKLASCPDIPSLLSFGVGIKSDQCLWLLLEWETSGDIKGKSLCFGNFGFLHCGKQQSHPRPPCLWLPKLAASNLPAIKWNENRILWEWNIQGNSLDIHGGI